MRFDTFTADTGQCILQTPDTMTPEDYADFVVCLKIIERKTGRSVKEQVTALPGQDESVSQ